MLRTISGVVVGLLVWGLIATLLNFGLRAGIPGYHAAEATLLFTPIMKAGRLIEAAIASVAAGMAVRAIAPSSRVAPWMTGLVILAMFVPVHIQLWSKFPVWYHLTFLLSILPLVVLGASIRLASGRREPASA